MTISNANQTLAAVNRWKYTSTGGETSLSGLDDNGNTLSYQLGTEQLHLNGILLVRGVDYVATTGSSITGLIALIAGDVIDIVSTVSTVISGMVPLSTVTTKGDLIAATGSGTVTNLAVGADGTTLVADSSTSTGLRYTAGTVQANPVLNSAFQVWQRGTSVAVAANTPTYTADRWCATGQAANEALTVSRQATGDTTNLPFIQYCGRVQRNSGQTGTGAVLFSNNFENINSTPFVGKTVTYSFYARAGANFSATSNTLNALLISGTGTDQNRTSTGWTGETNVASSTATLTTTWQRFTATGTVASTATQLGVYFSYAPTGTAGTNDYFEVTGVQIDIGSVALPFRTNAGTIQGETSACERYYQRYNIIGSYTQGHAGWAYGTTTAMFPIPLRTTMRVTPTSLETFQLQPWIVAGSTYVSSGTFALVNSSPNQGTFSITAGSAVFTAGQTVSLNTAANGSAYYGFSAEL